MQQKKLISPILFLYYEESLASSNLNSKLLRFHCAHPNVHSKKQLLRHLRLMFIDFQLYKYTLKCLSCKTYPFLFFMKRIVEFASEDPHLDLEINSGSDMIEAQTSSFYDSFLVVLRLTLLDGFFR